MTGDRRWEIRVYTDPTENCDFLPLTPPKEGELLRSGVGLDPNYLKTATENCD
tara:strand:+ start:923 stop:1081 length:159 start_codon:yes stop_codon:yes gene_type:complete